MRAALSSLLGVVTAAAAAGSFGAGALTGQEVVPAVHTIFHREPDCPAPQRIVVTLPPPSVEVRDRRCCDDDNDRRHSIFSKHRHHNKHGDRDRSAAPAADVFYAPAQLPSMLIQPTAAPAQNLSFTQQFSYDFAALRNAQEMEMRAAGLAAQIAARNAMMQAEDQMLKQMADRIQQNLKSLGGCMSAGSKDAAPKDTAADAAQKTKLDDALKNMNDRLDRLEELVLKHHQVIDSLRPVPKK